MWENYLFFYGNFHINNRLHKKSGGEGGDNQPAENQANLNLVH